MLEINVTRIIEEMDCALLSASVHELGQDAAVITWNNCRIAAGKYRDYLIGKHAEKELKEEIVESLRETCAYSEEELDEMLLDEYDELFAYLVQDIAYEYRQLETLSLEEIFYMQCTGELPGLRLYLTDDNDFIFCVGL